MWLSKVNVYCKYNVEREIVVVKKENLYSQVPKKKMVMNEMKMLEPKKKSFTKTWSTKNQYEISLGECLISLKKFLCMSEYSEIVLFPSRERGKG